MMNKTQKQLIAMARLLLFSMGLVWSCHSLAAKTYAIGKTGPGQGIIFHVTADGLHGLEAAPTDQGEDIWWYNLNYIYVKAVWEGINGGRLNTEHIIIAQGGGNYAALLCANYQGGGYGDWYLPSKEELNLMYQNIGPGAAAPLTNIGGFANDVYWSSTENGSQNAWLQLFFDNGGQGWGDKVSLNRVRAVRAF